MSVYVGSARIDENKNAHGGAAGDQINFEVSTQKWYLHSKGWRVFRAINPEHAAIIAHEMLNACNNPNIGYDQWERNTLYSVAEKVGFDLSKVSEPCETDCSALVRVCCAAAGINLPLGMNTASMCSELLKTGFFKELTETTHTESSDFLRVGDILVTRTKGHTVVVTETEEREVSNVPTIRKGDKGLAVRIMQTLLATYGYALEEHGVDGDFGNETFKQVKNFQSDNGLTVDGICGPLTWDALTL